MSDKRLPLNSMPHLAQLWEDAHSKLLNAVEMARADSNDGEDQALAAVSWFVDALKVAGHTVLKEAYRVTFPDHVVHADPGEWTWFCADQPTFSANHPLLLFYIRSGLRGIRAVAQYRPREWVLKGGIRRWVAVSREEWIQERDRAWERGQARMEQHARLIRTLLNRAVVIEASQFPEEPPESQTETKGNEIEWSRTLSPSELGLIFKRSPETISSWLKQGRLRSIKYSPKAYMIDLADLPSECRDKCR